MKLAGTSLTATAASRRIAFAVDHAAVVPDLKLQHLCMFGAGKQFESQAVMRTLRRLKLNQFIACSQGRLHGADMGGALVCERHLNIEEPLQPFVARVAFGLLPNTRCCRSPIRACAACSAAQSAPTHCVLSSDARSFDNGLSATQRKPSDARAWS